MPIGPNATHKVGVTTPSCPPSQPGAAEMVGKKRKQPSPLSSSIYTAAASTPGVVPHGFLAFFTEEELEADSRRFL